MSSDVVVAVPTYRRPALLARLLESLVPELEGRGVPVVVADNDAGAEAPQVVARSGLDAICIPVTRPGIAENRNALVREATRIRPGWRHLVMLDDDGYVTPGWFEALLGAAQEYGADVTGGPVLGELPPGASRLARNSIYAGRTRHPSGPVTGLGGAQNIVVSRRIVEAVGDPWFPPHLGRIGGEDHYFFEDVRAHGGTFAWCDEAPVVEPTPASRLSARALLTRAYRSNLISTHTALRFGTRAEVAAALARDTGWCVRKVAAGVVRRDPDRLAAATLDVASLSGRAAGLVSGRPPTRAHPDH